MSYRTLEDAVGNTPLVRLKRIPGPANEASGNVILTSDGKGTVGFSDCTFVQWGGETQDRYAIQAHGGTVMVQGCTFREDRPQIRLDEAVRRAYPELLFN